MKIKAVSGIMLTLLLVGMLSIAFTVVIVSADSEFVLETDKTVYMLGEEVTITFTNYSNETAYFPHDPPIEVYGYYHGWRIPVYPSIVLPWIIEVSPNQSRSWTWDQRDYFGYLVPQGSQVPPGIYDVFLPVYNLWTSFMITEPITATVDIDPDALNLHSMGEWVTAHIELPEGYNVSDIDISTIMLNNTFPVSLLVVPPVPVPTEIGDYDGDGISDLMVKFDRANVTKYITDVLKIEYGNVTLAISGNLVDETPLEGSDVIMVRMPGDVDDDGDVDPIDLGLFAAAYGTSLGDTYYKWAADFNEDGSVDANDLCIFGAYYGETAV